jgi:hypothetical protein
MPGWYLTRFAAQDSTNLRLADPKFSGVIAARDAPARSAAWQELAAAAAFAVDRIVAHMAVIVIGSGRIKQCPAI